MWRIHGVPCSLRAENIFVLPFFWPSLCASPPFLPPFLPPSLFYARFRIGFFRVSLVRKRISFFLFLLSRIKRPPWFWSEVSCMWHYTPLRFHDKISPIWVAFPLSFSVPQRNHTPFFSWSLKIPHLGPSLQPLYALCILFFLTFGGGVRISMVNVLLFSQSAMSQPPTQERRINPLPPFGCAHPADYPYTADHQYSITNITNPIPLYLNVHSNSFPQLTVLFICPPSLPPLFWARPYLYMLVR